LECALAEVPLEGNTGQSALAGRSRVRIQYFSGRRTTLSKWHAPEYTTFASSLSVLFRSQCVPEGVGDVAAFRPERLSSNSRRHLKNGGVTVVTSRNEHSRTKHPIETRLGLVDNSLMQAMMDLHWFLSSSDEPTIHLALAISSPACEGVARIYPT